MVVTNHALASAAGAEMLAVGGNAIDAAIASLFTLSVVEPMMVGIFGGGMANIRLPDGTHTILEGQARCPAGVGPTTFTPDPAAAKGSWMRWDALNSVGRQAVGVPGNLMAWCEMLSRWGRLPLVDVVEPAIRHAQRGFVATRYLARCVADCAADLAADPEIAAVFMPGGQRLQAGMRVVNAAYADTLRSIVREGPSVLYGGELGRAVAMDMRAHGAFLNEDDLRRHRTNELAVLRSTYRGFEITGPPPPSGGPLHIGQMLGILEGLDVKGSGFGSAQTVHWIAEVLKIAFADRAAATADPDHVKVPIERLLSREYSSERRAQIDPQRAKTWTPGVLPGEGAHTTHLTVADRDGLIISATQTINSLFGARYMVPGTGMIPNNYLYIFDPHPGRANSLAPGKRVTSSMSPLIVFREGRPSFALGLPGGLRIFPSAFQAVLNLIDHWHDVAGGRGGAAGVDPGLRPRARGRCGRAGVGRTGRARPSGAARVQRRRWHECDPLPRGRKPGGRGLLARRRGACGGGRWRGTRRGHVPAGGSQDLNRALRDPRRWVAQIRISSASAQYPRRLPIAARRRGSCP
jgi:gamma-glutamyltranspeptidase/glutathione hydrolase